MNTRRHRYCIATALFLLPHILAFSMRNSNNKNGNNGNNSINEITDGETGIPESTSRRNVLTFPIGLGGALVYGKLLVGSLEKLSRGDLVYPEDHERRVRLVLSKSLSASAQIFVDDEKKPTESPSNSSSSSLAPSPFRPFRVLEVGIGNEWRLARRGLYGDALQALATMGISDVEVTGVDLVTPKGPILQQARTKMESLAAAVTNSDSPVLNISLNPIRGSITSKLDEYPNGYFDAVVCSLTLCSVDNPPAALNEIHRLIRFSGGTFGYLEHVAVDEDEPYSFLEVQQKVLDPLQQALVDNCHLHRYTDTTIANEFELQQDNYKTASLKKSSSSSAYLLHERFLVDGMWPISCQCCGVIQQKA